MNFIIAAQPGTYLTGRTALNLPDPQAPSGDWHFTSAVLDDRARLHTGGASGEFVNTDALLGSYGVYDCSSVLRRMGVAVPQQAHIYAANHVRAVLDMALRSVLQRHQYPHHLETDKWLETEDQWDELRKRGEELAAKLTPEARGLFCKWLQSCNSDRGPIQHQW